MFIYGSQVPPSTFTRRPVQKTEHEQRIEQAQADKLVCIALVNVNVLLSRSAVDLC